MTTAEAFTTGTAAFHNGTGRALALIGIDNFLAADGSLDTDLANAFYDGWDHANITAAVA